MGGAVVSESRTPWQLMHGAPDSLTKLATGASAEVYAWGDDCVLKLYRRGFPPESIALELKNARSAHALGMPTPSVAGPVEWDGRSGLVFERVYGPTVYELMQAGVPTMSQLGCTLFDVQQSIHRCELAELVPLQASLAQRVRLARGLPETLRREAIDTLQRAPLADTVCHGDLHPLNVIMAASGPVVIDWLDMGRGDPAIDVVRTLLYLRYGRRRQIDQAVRLEFLNAYMGRCREVWSGRMEQLQHWLRPVTVARLSHSSVNNDERVDLMELLETRQGCLL